MTAYLLQIKVYSKQFDGNEDGKIEFEEFQNLIKFHADYLTKEGPHIKNFFNIFDGNKNGLISKEEFKSDMERVGNGLQLEFEESDINVLFDPSLNEDELIEYDELAKVANCFGKCIGGNMVTLAVLLL